MIYLSRTVRIGKRYTVVIPRELRRSLGVVEGQLAEVKVEGRRIVIDPLTNDPFSRLGELIGDVDYGSEARRKAERWLFRRAKRR